MNTSDNITKPSICRADACQQGRAPCPCPQACRVQDEDGSSVGLGVFLCAVSAVGVAALVAVMLS